MKSTRPTASTQRTYSRRLRARAAGLALVGTLASASLTVAQTNTSPEPVTIGYEILAVHPHDIEAFTQGLVFENGDLLESTGLNGRSSVRRVDIRTGTPKDLQRLPDRYFGEGLAQIGDRLFLLTYKSGIGFVLSREGFRRIGQFTYEGEGWGLAYDGRHLLMSDGSAQIEFRDPDTFAVQNTMDVTLRGRPLRNLNELEVICGRIFANVYGADQIVRIDPETGVVDGIVDLTGIMDPAERGGAAGDPPPVLNGIAYDPATDRLFVTGKLWPKLFEIRLTPAAAKSDPAPH